jgi:hypothetical protein
MKIPNFLNLKVIETEGENTGRLTPEAHNMFSELFTALQLNLSEEGFNIPQQTTANIESLEDDNDNGNILYDKEEHKVKVRIDGIYKTIQTV